MNIRLKYLLHGLEKNKEGASSNLIEGVLKQLDFSLPEDYLELMKEFDGGEGEIGENSWLCLFGINELLVINKNVGNLMDQIPDYFLFAKDAADTGYAFHKKKGTIHSFGLMSNFKTDQIKFCGNNFIEFIEFLFRQ